MSEFGNNRPNVERLLTGKEDNYKDGAEILGAIMHHDDGLSNKDTSTVTKFFKKEGWRLNFAQLENDNDLVFTLITGGRCNTARKSLQKKQVNEDKAEAEDKKSDGDRK